MYSVLFVISHAVFWRTYVHTYVCACPITYICFCTHVLSRSFLHELGNVFKQDVWLCIWNWVVFKTASDCIEVFIEVYTCTIFTIYVYAHEAYIRMYVRICMERDDHHLCTYTYVCLVTQVKRPTRQIRSTRSITCSVAISTNNNMQQLNIHTYIVCVWQVMCYANSASGISKLSLFLMKICMFLLFQVFAYCIYIHKYIVHGFICGAG